jgi:hypothetical protein
MRYSIKINPYESTAVTKFQHNPHSSKRLIESATNPLKIRTYPPKGKKRLSDVVLFMRPILKESLIKVFIHYGISFIDLFPAFSFSNKRLIETARIPFKWEFCPFTKKDC